MSDNTGIEWCDATWNPVTGCTEVSPGCDHCYAKTFAERWRGTPGHYFEHGFDVQLRPEKLDQPLRWRKPRRIFVNSMSDLFHDAVPDEYIARVWAVMALAPQHTFQVLTKRHARMRSLLTSDRFWRLADISQSSAVARRDPQGNPTLTNVWLGVSTENQQWADIRIPALLDTPAAVRFISAEPLLGPIDLRQSFAKWTPSIDHPAWMTADKTKVPGGVEETMRVRDVLHWVIVGGESGPGARPMHPDWARSLRDQCDQAGVPFLFKQWGEWAVDFPSGTHLLQTTGQLITRASGTVTNPYGHGSGVQDLVDRGHPGWVRVRRVGKKQAGRVLDGRTWDQYPESSTVSA
ncbi:phage Gp37/Gp68 family protein [Mycobacterium sp. NPDC049093]